MIRLSRGYLISCCPVVVGLVLASAPMARAENSTADLVVLHANVITVDKDHPRAEALAVRDGRFTAVGTLDEIQEWIGEKTQVIDARGKTITPGFNDAHLHPGAIYPVTSRLGPVDLRPSHVRTMDDLIRALKQKARITPKGQWVRGSRYEDTKLGRHPTRWDLDKVSTEHPVRLSHSSGHVSAFNSLALEMAKVDKSTPDPPGGSFDRDAHGVPNGVCRERAGSMVRRAGPSSPKPTRDEILAGMRRQFEAYASKGITSIGVAGTSLSSVRLYKQVQASGVPLRIYVMLRSLTELKRQRESHRLGDEWLKLGCVKIFHGNSLSGQTCWLYEPYANRPDYYGIKPARSQRSLNQRILDIHEAGFQVAVHSNGDREIDMVLDAIEKALEKSPRDNHRHRIEHCSVVNPRILERIKRLGVVVAPHSYVYEHGDKMEAYGADRCDMMHPNRSALELSIPVAGTSDSPVSEACPLLRIQSMVTRRTAAGKVYGARQKVTPEQAISIWTLGSAYASFDEDEKGSIEVGKLADFVVLSADPTQVAPETIKTIQVEKTLIGGKVVFERGSK